MKILTADFVTSAALRLAPAGREGIAEGGAPAAMGGIPHDGLGQIAFVGRSNVGKSTLLNALVRKKIARTSAAPGKTRLANIFRVDVEGGPGGPGRWSVYFVDLPGYGYARGGGNAADELRSVAEAYFATGERPRHERGGEERGRWAGNSRSARSVLLLVDSRHPGLESDIQAHAWLSGTAGAPVVVATKVDKLSRAERTRNLRELERLFGTAAVPVSATSGEGLDELWKLIARAGRNNASNADATSGRTGRTGMETGTEIGNADGARGADAPTSTADARKGTGTKGARR